MRFVAVAFILAVAVAPACLLPGSDNVTQSSNVELIVTGVAHGDHVTIDVAGSEFTSDPSALATVHFFFTLTPGEHEGEVTVRRHGADLCATFTIDAPAPPGRSTTSVSLDDASACDDSDAGPDGHHDAGHGGSDRDAGSDVDGGEVDAGSSRSLVRISEIVVAGCGGPSCTTTTEATSDGVVTLDKGGSSPVAGVASASKRDDLDSLALSAPADALFAGTDPTCPDPTPPQGDTVTLERTTETGSTSAVTETVNATGCANGVAQQIRAQLASMRAEIGAN
jgi:hypothetical protein